MTDNGRVEAGDYWREDSGSINFLEARALLCALDAFKSSIRNSRVDIVEQPAIARGIGTLKPPQIHHLN